MLFLRGSKSYFFPEIFRLFTGSFNLFIQKLGFGPTLYLHSILIGESYEDS